MQCNKMPHKGQLGLVKCWKCMWSWFDSMARKMQECDMTPLLASCEEIVAASFYFLESSRKPGLFTLGWSMDSSRYFHIFSKFSSTSWIPWIQISWMQHYLFLQNQIYKYDLVIAFDWSISGKSNANGQSRIGYLDPMLQCRGECCPMRTDKNISRFL